MKFKRIFFVLFILVCMSCSKKENEFNEGDQYIEDGIIYTYYNLDIERPFKKEANENFYNQYYYDMSNIETLSDVDLFPEHSENSGDYWDVLYKYYSSPLYAPIDAVSYKLNDMYDLEKGFIVTGYTNDVSSDVFIRGKIKDEYVYGIGFKALTLAPIKSIKIMNEHFFIIHPYAFDGCNELLDIKTRKDKVIVLSMGISNCNNLKYISGITLFSDCSLYNLNSLVSLEFLNDLKHDRYGSIIGTGLRKSSIYLCPNLKEINLVNTSSIVWSGSNYSFVYHQDGNYISFNSIPFYVFDNYKIELSDKLYTKYQGGFICYDENNNAYLPFLNNGLNYVGEITIAEGSEKFSLEDGHIYFNFDKPDIQNQLFYKTKIKYL